MPKLTPQEAQEKHNRNLKNAVEDMRLGVERVNVAPTKLAAEKADKMLNNLTKAVQSGKWANGLNRVTLEDWKSKMINKGINRVATGIDEAADKVQDFYSDLFPHIEAGQSKVNKMNDVTLEDSINRMTTFVRHMAGFKRSK